MADAIDLVLDSQETGVQLSAQQQAEIMRHAFLLRRGENVAGVADKAAYGNLVDFQGAKA